MLNIVTLAMRLMRNRDRIPELAELLARLAPEKPPQHPAFELDESEPQTSSYPVGSIEWLQDSLNTVNAAGLEVDGDYGPATKQAVSDYQSEHDLKVDGWAGPETVNSIVTELAS